MRHVLGLALACATLSLVAGGCSTNPATGKREFVVYTTEQEIQMGREAHPVILSKLGGKTDDATLQEYLTKVGQKITGVCERDLPYAFHVVNAPWANAMAMPGGNVYVNLGLFPYLDNERQLAAVLGHEVGHAAARHGVKKQQLGQATGIVAKEVWNRVRGKTEFDQAITKATEMGLDMLNKRYSRNQEYEADRLGIRYMGRAEYNPWGAVEFLRNLSKTAKTDESTFDELFYTHPLFPKRIAAAEREVRKAYPDAQPGGTAENAVEFAAMKARALALLAKFSKGQVEAQKQKYRDGLGRKKGGGIETDDEPTVDKPTVDKPTDDKPTDDEPTTDEPTTDEPTADEPTTDEPTTDEGQQEARRDRSTCGERAQRVEALVVSERSESNHSPFRTGSKR